MALGDTQTKVNATGTSDSTGSSTGGEPAGVDNTEQGTSEPPEPTPDRDVAEHSCHVEVACHARCIADDAAALDPFDGASAPGAEALTGWLRDRMCQIAEHVGVHTGTVSIAIVDDAVMAGLHREHLGKSGRRMC